MAAGALSFLRSASTATPQKRSPSLGLSLSFFASSPRYLLAFAFNAVCPGGVDTPMLAAEAEEQGMEIDDFLAMVAQSSPNGRIAAPEDVAALVLFLASDAASHITGTNIPCDGGVMA